MPWGDSHLIARFSGWGAAHGGHLRFHRTWSAIANSFTVCWWVSACNISFKISFNSLKMFPSKIDTVWCRIMSDHVGCRCCSSRCLWSMTVGSWLFSVKLAQWDSNLRSKIEAVLQQSSWNCWNCQILRTLNPKPNLCCIFPLMDTYGYLW